jgi:hypothetical protein
VNPFAVALAVILAVYLALALRKHPRAALTVWLACITLVPVWLEIRIGGALQPLSVLAVCLLPSILHNWKGRLKAGDWLMVAVAAVSTVAWVLFDSPQYAWVGVFTQWIAAYLVGRSLGPSAGSAWVTKAMAITGTLVGIWALAEFALSWHVFQSFAVELDSAGWHNVQIRGQFDRSEGAFGHSIAMGGFLALCVPFVIANPTTMPRRVTMLAITAGGALVTFSRGPIIGLAIAIVLSVLFLAQALMSRQTRAAFVILTVVAAVAIVPQVLGIFDSVSSDLGVSADYRQDLAASFLPDLRPLGIGGGVFYSGERLLYRQFTSIDNAYALLGLQLGWLPLALLCVGLIAVAVRLLKRQGGPADVALVAQAFILFTVALITQYGMAVFFVAGLAVGFGAVRRNDEKALPDARRSGVRQGLRQGPSFVSANATGSTRRFLSR